MKYENTEASNCRYGEYVGAVLRRQSTEEPIIIWENSSRDYQGHGNILAKCGEEFVHYEWDYGSCSGCDEWESRGLSDAEIENEIESGLAILKSPEGIIQYCRDTTMLSALRKFLKTDP